MRKLLWSSGLTLLVATVALAAPADRWLHVRVEGRGEQGESVRVNVPLDLAIKVLPTIHADRLQDGRVKIQDARLQGVDLRGLLDAVRAVNDGEFVTVQSNDEQVRVAKAGGYLLVKVNDTGKNGKKAQKVDVKVPLPVIDALLSGPPDELNVLAAVEALAAHGDDVLVTVEDDSSHVRIWVDSQSE